MFVQQISIFVENKSGRMADITRILADKNINIQALSIADTTDFGILRLIVNDPKTAVTALKEKGVTVRVTDVVAVPMADRPGSLADVMRALDESDIGIEYMYAFTARVSAEALVILCTEDPAETTAALARKNIATLPQEVVYGL